MKKYLHLVLSVLHAIGIIVYIALVLPVNVSTHFNAMGVADQVSSKWAYLILAFLPLVLSCAFLLYRHLTRANANVQANRKYEDMLIPLIIVMFIALGWIFVLQAEGERMQDWAGPAVIMLIGLMFLFLANYMAKLEPNKTFGLRTRSTLADAYVWRKAHRVTGIAGTVGGLLMILCGIIGLLSGHPYAWAIPSLIAAILITVGIPSVYAMRLYNQRHPK